MAAHFTVTLDTTGPTSPTLSINSGATYATSVSVTANFGTADSSTTGYQIKVWGDVDETVNANIQEDEGDSSWISYNATQSVTLATGDGSKTLYAKIRDDVWNETSELSDTITLDTTAPVVTITSGPDVSKVSKISGKRTVSFTWQSDQQYDAYKVKVVPSSGSADTAGTTVLTTNGSTNVSGSSANQPASTPVSTSIDGRDLEVASSGDGDKIIKVFVQDDSGIWSV